MTELARGTIGDRPWGRTLGALGMRGLSGQLTLLGDGKAYRIAFHEGAVVGATSPLASDAAVRLALTGGLVTSTQVADITRRIAASSDRDEVDVVAEAARLGGGQAVKLRRRLVAQRAARTFSVEQGEFVVDDRVDVPVVPGSELDIRAIIYLGARSNLTEERLAAELEQLGAWFKILPEAVGDLVQFGFTETDKPILQKLVAGANLVDLEHVARDGVGERGVRAIVYALVSCNACEVEAQPQPTVGRTTRETFERPATATSERKARPSPPPPTQRARTNSPVDGSDRAPPPAARAGTNPPVQARTPSAELPEGMQLRTPATLPAAARTPTPTGPQLGRSPTNPTVGRAPTPATTRTPTPTGPQQGRSPTGPQPGRSPTNPAVGRTPSPGAAVGRSPTNPAVGRTPSPGAAVGRTPTPGGAAVGRTPTPGGAAVGRTPTPISISRTMTPSMPSAFSRPRSPSPMPPTVAAPPAFGAARAPQGPRVKRNTQAAQETEGLIRDRLALLERGADHFMLLGIARDASPDVTRAAYFTLARKLHPDRLASLGINDAQHTAQRLFAEINAGFAILNDPVRRLEYVQILGRGGESAVRADEAKADELAMRVMHAEEAFRRGEMALRRDQLEQALVEFTTAADFQPGEPEYQALLTWTRFAAATDKQAIAQETRQKLSRAVDQSENSPAARFYLGRVERILGREREALAHFQEVLRIKPNHAEASSEIRVLEGRLKKK